jgi:glycosyltransferase involved in cell wall biosynthesis
MRILFVALQFPIPANNGLKMRSWSLLQALAAEGHELSLVYFQDSSDVRAEILPLGSICQDLTAVPFRFTSLSSSRDYWRRALALFSLHPYAAGRFVSPLMRERIKEVLSRHRFDLIIADTAFSMLNLPTTDVPITLNAHNLEYMILKRYLSHESNPLKLAYGWLETQKVRGWESDACSHADYVMCCSKHDKELIQELCPRVPISVIPNIVDVNNYGPTTDVDEPVLIYQGGMDWYPNRDAVEYLVFEILPILRRSVPDCRVIVAGRNPSPEFRRQFDSIPHVSFTGTVPDMRLEIAKAAVSVVPLRIGSGTRMKILEAAAMGKPIVSTTLGAEGLEFVDGSEIVLADQPQAFADAVAGLLCDAARRRSIGRAARRRVEQQYSMTALRSSLHDLTVTAEGQQAREVACQFQ